MPRTLQDTTHLLLSATLGTCLRTRVLNRRMHVFELACVLTAHLTLTSCLTLTLTVCAAGGR